MGNTYYAIYEESIDKNCKDLFKAFHGIDFQPAYSVKTNYTPMIVKRFHDNGFLTEVVSDMEVEIAMSVGIPLDRIVYNGPLKGKLAADVANAGGIVCFDNIDDIEASRYDEGARCMVRVAVDVGNGVDTRFGTKASEVRDALLLARAKGYDTVGIHCHVTKGRGIRFWRSRVEIMADVFRENKDLLSERIIDFGGNMYSPLPYEKAKEHDDYASYSDYASLFRELSDRLVGVKIMIETGTSVVANCVAFITHVVGIKHTGRNTYVLLDACKYNLGWATEHYNFPMVVINRFDTRRERVEGAFFVGRLCVENDVIYTGYSGDIGIGDIVRFTNAGAYTMNIKPPFIMPQCEIWYVPGNGPAVIAKRAETAGDILGTFNTEVK